MVTSLGDLDDMMTGSTVERMAASRPKRMEKPSFPNRTFEGGNIRPSTRLSTYTNQAGHSASTASPSHNNAYGLSKSPLVRTSVSNRLELADSPYVTAMRIRNWIDSRPRPFQDKDVESLYTMVISGNRSQIDVVAWNMLFILLGRQGKLDRMWRAFNEVSQGWLVCYLRQELIVDLSCR